MSGEANKAIVLRWVEEVFNRGDSAALRELVAEDAILHTSGYLARGTMVADRTAFPDLHKTVDLLFAEGDFVVLRATNRGVHLGAFVLPRYGTFPPSGRRVRWSHVTIYRLIGGRIVEIWEHTNWLQLLEQVGATVATSGSGASATAASPPPRQVTAGAVRRWWRRALARYRTRAPL